MNRTKPNPLHIMPVVTRKVEDVTFQMRGKRHFQQTSLRIRYAYQSRLRTCHVITDITTRCRHRTFL